MRRRLPLSVLVAALSMGAGSTARADDRDKDTRARHDRASSRSSSSSSSNDRDRDRDRRRPRGYFVPPPVLYGAPGGYGAEVTAAPSFQLGGELYTSAFVSPGGLGVVGGATILTQQGWAGGFVLGGALFDDRRDVSRRFGLAFEMRVVGARLLDDHQPLGADYRSDLDLFAIELDAGPQWRQRIGALGLTYGIGVGLTTLRAHERFSDGLALDDSLATGLRLRPYLRFDSPSGEGWGRLLGQIGVAGFFGRTTEYASDYDSLVDGLSPMMLAPYLRAGYLYELAPGLAIGTTYEVELGGALTGPLGVGQRLLLSFRIGSVETL